MLPYQIDIRPVYTSHRIRHEIKPKEKKLPIINQPHVVYHYKCGLCDQTMLGIHADTSISALKNTKDCRQSGITLKYNMEQSQMTYIVTVLFIE